MLTGKQAKTKTAQPKISVLQVVIISEIIRTETKRSLGGESFLFLSPVDIIPEIVHFTMSSFCFIGLRAHETVNEHSH